MVAAEQRLNEYRRAVRTAIDQVNGQEAANEADERDIDVVARYAMLMEYGVDPDDSWPDTLVLLWDFARVSIDEGWLNR